MTGWNTIHGNTVANLFNDRVGYFDTTRFSGSLLWHQMEAKHSFINQLFEWCVDWRSECSLYLVFNYWKNIQNGFKRWSNDFLFSKVSRIYYLAFIHSNENQFKTYSFRTFTSELHPKYIQLICFHCLLWYFSYSVKDFAIFKNRCFKESNKQKFIIIHSINRSIFGMFRCDLLNSI